MNTTVNTTGTAKEQPYSRQLIDRLGSTLGRLGDGLTKLEVRVEDVIQPPGPTEPTPKDSPTDERQPRCYMEDQLLGLCHVAESREARLHDISDRIVL